MFLQIGDFIVFWRISKLDGVSYRLAMDIVIKKYPILYYPIVCMAGHVLLSGDLGHKPWTHHRHWHLRNSHSNPTSLVRINDIIHV